MNRFTICLGCALVVWLMYFGQAASADVSYTEWVNYRYQYQFDLPNIGLVPGREPENGDGRGFALKNGRFTVTVWGSNNALDTTVAKTCEDTIASFGKGSKVSYRRVTKTWFVVSGRLNAREAFYQKTIYHNDQFDTILIRYASKDAPRFDPIVARISHSFRYVPHKWIVNGSYLAGTESLK